MTVVNFRKEVEKIEPLVWMCNCGNCSFRVYSDGALACAECDTPQTYDAHYQAVAKWTVKERVE